AGRAGILGRSVMTRKFCPDYGALATHRGYRPMHSWFVGQPLMITVFKDGPKYFPTSGQAREAAKEFVASKINGRDRAEMIEPEAADPLQAEIEDFLRNREARAEAEKRAVFGDAP